MILADLCVRRPVFATMLVGVLVVLGWFSYMRLGVDLFPKVDVPTVMVTTFLPGAAPEETEARVTKPIEEAINTVSGIDEMRSNTLEGVSRIIIEFKLERDLDAAVQDVRDKISTVLDQLPDGTKPPLVQKFDLDAVPVVTITVTGYQSLKELTELARRRLKEPLESVDGVGSIDIGKANIFSLMVAHLRGIPFVLESVAAMYSSASPTVGFVVSKESALTAGAGPQPTRCCGWARFTGPPVPI